MLSLQMAKYYLLHIDLHLKETFFIPPGLSSVPTFGLHTAEFSLAVFKV